MSHKSLLSVVIPVYNERNTAGEVVRRVRSIALPAGLEREIIVVDDGSTDGTTNILRTIEDSTVRVIRHSENKGQGAAVRSALEVARGDIVLIQDADLEYEPMDIPRLLAPLLAGTADVVYGNRYHARNSATKLTSFIVDRSISLLTSVLYNRMLIDVETGSRAFLRSVLSATALESDRFEFSTELTGKLLRSGSRIMEVSVTYSGRLTNKRTRRDRVKTAWTLIRQRFAATPAPKTLPDVAPESTTPIVDITDKSQKAASNQN